MIYFKSPTGEVFAYETREDRVSYGAKNLVEMSVSEVEEHLSPSQKGLSREQVEVLRLVAYADPLTGSDRFFVEAARLQAADAPAEEIETAKSNGVKRYEEIQAAYPWPDSK